MAKVQIIRLSAQNTHVCMSVTPPPLLSRMCSATVQNNFLNIWFAPTRINTLPNVCVCVCVCVCMCVCVCVCVCVVSNVLFYFCSAMVFLSVCACVHKAHPSAAHIHIHTYTYPYTYTHTYTYTCIRVYVHVCTKLTPAQQHQKYEHPTHQPLHTPHIPSPSFTARLDLKRA